MSVCPFNCPPVCFKKLYLEDYKVQRFNILVLDSYDTHVALVLSSSCTRYHMVYYLLPFNGHLRGIPKSWPTRRQPSEIFPSKRTLDSYLWRAAGQCSDTDKQDTAYRESNTPGEKMTGRTLTSGSGKNRRYIRNRDIQTGRRWVIRKRGENKKKNKNKNLWLHERKTFPGRENRGNSVVHICGPLISRHFKFHGLCY